ncbi:MAG: hypothetical protein F6K26_32600 [Moorea sp. SIO2I5]|nr:hypothetical protein [Moorena sp. SIO2I5]
MNFSPDGKIVALANTGNKTVKLVSIDGKLLHTLFRHKIGVNHTSFNSDGSLIASGSLDGMVKLWSVDGQLLQTFPAHTYSLGVQHVSFSADDKILASAGADGTVKLWSLDGQLLQTLQGHEGIVRYVAFNPDGKIIASADEDGSIKLWHLDLEKLVKHSCDWVHGYLRNNPNVSTSDRYLCD